MGQYSIWVLEYSFVKNYHKSGVLYGAHNQGYVKLPYCYALIKGNGHVAMVDVGYNDKDYGKHLGDKFAVENWHSPQKVLAGIGLLSCLADVRPPPRAEPERGPLLDARTKPPSG